MCVCVAVYKYYYSMGNLEFCEFATFLSVMRSSCNTLFPSNDLRTDETTPLTSVCFHFQFVELQQYGHG